MGLHTAEVEREALDGLLPIERWLFGRAIRRNVQNDKFAVLRLVTQVRHGRFSHFGLSEYVADSGALVSRYSVGVSHGEQSGSSSDHLPPYTDLHRPIKTLVRVLRCRQV